MTSSTPDPTPIGAAARRRRRVCGYAMTASATALVLAVSGCAASSGSGGGTSAAGHDHGGRASASVGVSASAGSLRITGAYVPAPASPDVAAAYFTVRNDGDTADTLTAVRSDVSSDTGLHGYSAPGRMVDLPALPIPAHGQAALKVGSTHIMIMNPTKPLTAGTTVRLTLSFTRAGTVAMRVPVVATTGPMDSMPSGMDMHGDHG